MNRTIISLLIAIVAVAAVTFAIWQTSKLNEETRLRTEAVAATAKSERDLRTVHGELVQAKTAKESAEKALKEARQEIIELKRTNALADVAAKAAQEQLKRLQSEKATSDATVVEERRAREAAERALAAKN